MAFPLFVSTSRYRKHHLSHHRHLNTSQDPDLITETKKNRWQWLRLFFCDITGISALTALKTISTWSILAGVLAQPDSDAAVSPSEKQRFLVFAIAAVGFISLFHLWFEVLIFWLVPLLTVLNAAFRIRNIAEHFGCPNQTKLNASRTVLANPIERFLIAPCNINYHLEHHLYPQVPLYNLQRLHGLLYQRQSYAASAHLNTSYCFGQRSVLKEVVNDAPPHSS